ncbi:MAG: TerB N-terminal domain-containing protein, partial [Clostridia bacterium]|nr:TerB N-terminal domain-containing protein [Clostridia bacterium]
MPLYKENREYRDLGDDSFWKMTSQKEKPAGESFDKPSNIPADLPSVSSEGAKAETPSGKRKASGPFRIPEGKAETAELLEDYAPEDSLIARVTVYRGPSSSFYGNFVKNAHLSHGTRGDKSRYVPFFAFIPTYSALTYEQKKYYFYFRDCAREGTYLRSDTSYILLYIYEIINLPDLIPPPEGLRLLIGLWQAYRANHREIDNYLAEWIPDYVFIYKLPLPDLPPELARAGFSRSSVPEFFLRGRPDENGAERFALSLSEAAGGYRMKNSRYYARYSACFDTVGNAAAGAAVLAMKEAQEGIFAPGSLREMKIVKEAFCGSLCEHNIKRRIEIRVNVFAPLKAAGEEMGNLQKYIENRI